MKKLLLASIIGMVLMSITHAQSPKTNLIELERLARDFQQTHRSEMEKARAIIKRWGIPEVIRYPDGTVAALNGLDDSGYPEYLITYNNTRAAATTNTTALWQGGSLGLNLSGRSEFMNGRLGIWEAGGNVLTTHEELTGRVTIADDERTASSHATHVAGTMIASGVNPIARGMAFGAQLRAYGSSNDLSEMTAAANGGMLLSNHSYGTIAGWYSNSSRSGTADNPRWEWHGDPTVSGREDWKFGFYDNRCRDLDRIVFNAPYYLPVFAAANSRTQNGPAVGQPYWQRDVAAQTGFRLVDARPDSISSNNSYNTIPTAGNAKNILTIGAVNPIANGYTQPTDVVMSAFSSWGPTDDGRIKPDLVGNGVAVVSATNTANNAYTSMQGTSMATPNVSGTLFLLQELYGQQNQGNFMLAATLKALAIHTANEAGNAPGPDYQFGWGLLNAEQAGIVILNRDRTHAIREEALAQNQTFTLNVVASGNGPLKATLVWTDPEGTVLPVIRANLNNPSPRLVNDLDLRIIEGSTTHLPWVLNPEQPAAPATRGDNIRDNVEQVLIENPIPGKAYTIRISHKGTLRGNLQNFSLILSGIGGTAYCTSAPTSDADSRIEGVTIADFNHSPVNQCRAYADFTNLTAFIAPGQRVNLSIGIGTCGANFPKIARVYIDWNGNGNFTDEGELVATSGVINSSETYTTNFQVPNTVQIGRFSRLRIVLSETTNAANIAPCGNYAKGETRDYTVLFVRPQADIAVTGLISPTSGICPEQRVQTVEVGVRNLGTIAINTGTFSLVITDPQNSSLTNLSGTFNFPSGLPSLASSFVRISLNQPISLQAGTTYTVRTTFNVEGDANPNNNTNVSTFRTADAGVAPTGLSAIACGSSGPVTLRRNSEGSGLYWYDAPVGGNLIGAGNQVVTNIRPANGRYYAGINDFVRTGFGPRTKEAFASGNYNQFSPSITVRVQQPVVIESARLYIGNSGVLQFTVTDVRTREEVSSVLLNVRATRTVPGTGSQENDPLDSGQVYRLDLRFPRAGDYEIAIAYGGGATIYRNNNIPELQNPYPQTQIPGVFAITGNTATPNPNTFWYYFYDITLRALGCSTPRAEVQTTQVAALSVTITTSRELPICQGESITLTANSSDPLVTYQWRRNGVNIINANQATLTIAEEGEFSVVVTNMSGCAITSNPIRVNVISVIKPVVSVRGQIFTSSSPTGNQWLLNGNPIPGATGQTYNADQAGIYAVRVTSDGCTATSDPIVLTAAENAASAPTGLSFYPNPVGSSLKVAYSQHSNTSLEIRITDLTGKVLHTQQIQKRSFTVEEEINVQGLASGIYFLQISTGEGQVVRKFVKE
ncbi:MAG: S8 family serine peptidase [Cytophagales bacterium]|nr:S8 family serine peptidase [Bernardetiaceae bacterium]MDW8204095.1 S8 family serine peptidase [Cytophagales bacterium]